MSKVTMPEPVAYFYQRDFDKYKDRYPGGIPVITTTQAEAYADARVREALEATGGHRLVEPDHETAMALADAPRSLRNYVAALRSAIALQSHSIAPAARELALWAYGEVGADLELTPGLAQLLQHFGISDDAPAALQSQVKNDKTLFCDLKTDEEKSAFFLSGRGYETGVIALSIQNDVAMAYHRCAEYKKELEVLQHSCKETSQDRADAERYRWIRDEAGLMVLPYDDHGLGPEFPCGSDLDKAIDDARSVEGEGK